MIVLFKFMLTGLGLVIFARAVVVIHEMDLKSRRQQYLLWLAFGVSYAFLAVAALGSIMRIWEEPFELGHSMWLVASAGLIVFDRRPRERWDPEATRPMGERA